MKCIVVLSNYYNEKAVKYLFVNIVVHMKFILFIVNFVWKITIFKKDMHLKVILILTIDKCQKCLECPICKNNINC